MDIQSALYYFVGWLGTILTAAIVIRALLSWFAMGNTSGPVFRLLDDITEPVMSPFRRVIPTLGMIDISPLVAILVIQFVTSLLQRQLVG